ncbi:hypothetical protein C0J52_04021 [Blattella germanica]|nr:hypothetical protein C0J52_04021 [Blattella germanica]
MGVLQVYHSQLYATEFFYSQKGRVMVNNHNPQGMTDGQRGQTFCREAPYDRFVIQLPPAQGMMLTPLDSAF